jgi:methyltransferase (TIGR00027 family)
MAEKVRPGLEGVPETLLMPLYMRALESQRPDGLIHDEKAAAIVHQMDYDFDRLEMQSHDQAAVILRACEFDRIARDFLVRNPRAQVVHLGCGLDTRFERVDNGQVEWFDLDLPEVIALRQRFIPCGEPRYHLVSSSVHEEAWLDMLELADPRPVLFLSEGVLLYFEEEQVRSLVQRLRARFPGSELAFDGQSPLMIYLNNLQLAFTPISARLHWALRSPHDVERWGEGIHLLEEWYFFDRPEPRFGPLQWFRYIPPLAKATGVYHYKLG